jgi:hypothetical protein
MEKKGETLFLEMIIYKGRNILGNIVIKYESAVLCTLQKQKFSPKCWNKAIQAPPRKRSKLAG